MKCPECEVWWDETRVGVSCWLCGWEGERAQIPSPPAEPAIVRRGGRLFVWNREAGYIAADDPAPTLVES